MSIIRDNLVNRPGYAPYCGNTDCPLMPRTTFNGKQFECSCCGWQSGFEPEFIEQIKGNYPDMKAHISREERG